jgi:hypothetical protein
MLLMPEAITNSTFVFLIYSIMQNDIVINIIGYSVTVYLCTGSNNNTFKSDLREDDVECWIAPI